MAFVNGVTNYDEWRNHAKDNQKYKERMAVISEMLPKKDSLTFADEVRLVQQVAVSALTGKLEDFWSISTSVLMNPICQARAKCDGCICKDCYAASNVARFSGLTQALETNYLILNNFLISEEAWSTLAIPSVNGKSRIESHGDTATEICSINYLRIVRSHKYLFFGLWSKNLHLYKRPLETEGKPDNMNFIASSPMENVVMELPEWARQYIDKVFTVYTEEYAREHNITINCGTWERNALDHRCKLCFRCYNPGDTDYYINELKK